MVTHPHIDHDEALYDIDHKFHIERYIDDGKRVGSGKKNQMFMEDSAEAQGIRYESLSFEDITKNGNRNGVTDSIIDPVNCANGDPQIILYSGQFAQRPGDWTASDFTNYNNHSLVVKVLFGQASFLFTGDLETKGIQAIVDEYANTRALHADILMVGHHGAANATTEAYLDAVTPSCAVISCGEWDFGKDENNMFTTYAYGHPRISTINMLEERIPGMRTDSVRVEAAEGARDFRLIDVDKRIYATPWDHTIVISATLSGRYHITTNN
jgi:competence protein ComEC